MVTPYEQGTVVSAAGLVGPPLIEVRYCTLDYDRWQYAPEVSGRRQIVNKNEWVNPTWKYALGDSVDFGIEFVVGEREPISVTWQTAAAREGLVIHPGVIVSRSNIAEWNVGNQGRWRELIGQSVEEVIPHSARWGREGADRWIPWISMVFTNVTVEILLGTFGYESRGVVRSANNIVVLFDPGDLPDWIPRFYQ